jgi:hypothetical protein
MARRMRPDPQLFMLASGHHGRGGRVARAVWAADAEYREAAGGKR